MIAAINSAKNKGATKIIVACPIISADTISELEVLVDEVIYLHAPLSLGAIGQFYEDFEQTEDEEVEKIMESFKA